MKTNNISVKSFTTFALGIFFIFISCVSSEENSTTASTQTQQLPRGEKLVLYLVAVPESSLSNAQRLRQDDEDIARPTFAQTGEHIGQIVQGVLGGDLRPVFAGSVGFVEAPVAQKNLATFLGNIAPVLNLALREVYLRAQTAFGFGGTTAKPTQAANATASASQPVTEAGNASPPVTAYFEQFEQPPAIQQQQEPSSSTTSWQYVLNQIYAETTSLEPLPLIRRTTSSSFDGDDGDDDAKRRV